MLEVVVFMCGASLMGLEFLAARMLAPTLGSSIFVWGSVISIVMLALSIGYWLGGQVADRYGATRTLPPVIALAGLFTVAVPWVSRAVLPSMAPLGARTGSLVSSAIVFFAPSLLLAMVSPLAIRLAAEKGSERIGRSAGSLYAISTAGSIAGTLATAFWLIPLMSLDPLVVAIGFTLLASAGLAAVLPALYREPERGLGRRGGRGLRWVTVAAAALAVVVGVAVLLEGPAAGFSAGRGERTILQRDTLYHRIYVTENDEERLLRFDRSRQSSMYLDDPFETSFPYPGYFHTALAIKPDARSVLVIGLGGGSAIKRFWRDYPDMTIDVVEIDPDVVDIAKRYFELPSDPRIRIHTEDGRRFLAEQTANYDIIIMDAYYADALPSHLTTVEFFRTAKARLSPGGVLAYNIIGAVDGSGSRLFRGMHRTAASVWERLWVLPVELDEDPRLTVNRNIIVLATDARMTEEELRARLANRVGGRVTLDGFSEMADDLYTERVSHQGVPVLTDQHAPTDSLIEVN